MPATHTIVVLRREDEVAEARAAVDGASLQHEAQRVAAGGGSDALSMLIADQPTSGCSCDRGRT